MSSFRIRPRFKKECALPVRELEQKFVEIIKNNDDNLVGTVSKNFITIKVPQEDNHYWSPRLTIMLDESEDGKTTMRGLYGPNPNVWSFFAYSYGAIGLSIFFITLFGLSMYSIGEGGWLLWWNIPLVAVGITLYIIAQFGQKIGAEQMFRLHHFFENAIKEHVHID